MTLAQIGILMKSENQFNKDVHESSKPKAEMGTTDDFMQLVGMARRGRG